MRLIKKSRWFKTFLAVILFISITGQSLTAYAADEDEIITYSITAGSDTSGDTGGQSTNANWYSGQGWLISIQEVDNTATDVPSGYTEAQISFDNAWLHDFPDCYINDVTNNENASKYAFIGKDSAKSSYYRVYSPTTNSTTKQVVKNYKASSGKGKFSEAALLLESSEWYDDILTGLKNYSLTSEYVIYAANNSSLSLDDAISAFVKLWQDSGSVDDAINSFVFDTDDYWEQLVRYLDLLIIVNAMCDNAWSNAKESTDYIQDYLDNLNNNGSDKFVAIVVAAAVNCTASSNTSYGLMTLPVYYNQRTGQGISMFSSWSGSGNWDDVKSEFNTYSNTARYGMSDNGTEIMWWSNANMATSVYPVGSDGSLGFCGYTYIAPAITTNDPDDIIKPTDSSNPSSSPSSSVAATDVVTPTFTVEVTTENEYMQRDKTQPVTATVTIDMGQTDAVQKTFKNIYTSLKNKEAETGESYKTAIEVFVERTFSDSSGKDTSYAVMDSDASDGYFAYAVQPDPYTNCVVYRWQGTDWDSGSNQLQYVMDGTHQIVFDDEGLSLASVTEGTPLNATYHVGIRMAIYPSSVSDKDAFDQAEYLWIFQGEGKTICSDSGNSDCSGTFFIGSTTDISTTQSAHDDAEWICPDGVQWYSSLRDGGNWAEVKQGAPNSETYEAMAGVPTDEDLYLGVGYNEFMVNLEGDVVGESAKRYYTYTITVTNCIEEDEDCERHCPGHELDGTCTNTVYCDGSYSGTIGINGTATITCSGGCGKSNTFTGIPGASVDEDCDNTYTCDGTYKCSACGATSGGTKTITYTCDGDCGQTKTGDITAAYSCSKTTGSGCYIKHIVNSAHPHSHTYTFTTTQLIAPYYYLDIDGLEVWRASSIVYDANNDLLSNGDLSISPSTAVRVFNAGAYSSGSGRLIFSTSDDSNSSSGYLSDVSFILPNISYSGSGRKVSSYIGPIRNLISQKSISTINGTYATVMSDYVDLQNTDGTVQVIAGSTYQSNACNYTYSLGSSDFPGTGTKITVSDTDGSPPGDGPSKTDTDGYETGYSSGDSITFNPSSLNDSSGPWKDADCAEEDLWIRYDSTSKTFESSKQTTATLAYINYQPKNYVSYSYDSFGSFDLYRIGYNGNYNHPESGDSEYKYKDDNTADTVSLSDTILNTSSIATNSSGANILSSLGSKVITSAGGGSSGTGAYLRTGLNIRDYYAEKDGHSSNIYHPSTSDTSHDPVTNGEWDTGNVYFYAVSAYYIQTDNGVQWYKKSDTDMMDGKNYNVELTYTKGKDKVNNIVIHNPEAVDANGISGVAAQVVSIDSKYDQRVGVDSRKQTINAVGLDREFTVTFPTVGNFYGNGSTIGTGWGILDCTATPGKGYTNGMNTERWIRDKYVTFSFDVLVENSSGGYDAYEAGTPVPWYTYFEGSDEGKFYCPLENSEQADGYAVFQVISVNSPTTEGLAKENSEIDNKYRDRYTYAATHDAYYQQTLDVIGYIGALSINDDSDPRFAELFKWKAADVTNDDKDESNWLITGLVHRVDLSKPKTVVTDQQTAKEESASGKNFFQDVWQTLTPGSLVYRSDGTSTNNRSDATADTARSYWPGETSANSTLGGKWKSNLSLPLTPKYLSSISNGLTKQATRVGYDLYMDIQTVGNYYGRGDNQKVTIKPNYYLVVPTGQTDANGYAKVNTYALNVYATGSSGKYSLINYQSDIDNATTIKNLKAGKVYLDWENEADRRNATAYELAVTDIGDTLFWDITGDDDSAEPGKSVTTSDKHSIGTTQLIQLVDIDKTYVGSQYTNGDGSTVTYMNGVVKDMYAANATRVDDNDNVTSTYYLWGSSYIVQAQRYHFTISLPSSSRFVLTKNDTDYTYSTKENEAYEELASKDGAHIICVLEVEAEGQVWTLEYSRYSADSSSSSQHQTYTYQDYEIKDPVPSTYESSDSPIVAVYDPLKTSADDIDTVGTH